MLAESEVPLLLHTARVSASHAETAVWRLRLLGGFALDGAQQLRLPRLRSRAATVLLARLALAPGRDHPREELIDLLWPEASAEAGRSRLRQTLSLLRAVLEPPGGPAVVLADRRALRLVPDVVWCDASAFERLLGQGQTHQALALYRGTLLPGFYDEWVLEERTRLQALADELADACPARQTPAARFLPAATAPQPALPRGPARPPAYLTRLIGTQEHAARLRELVAQHRLVTVLGAGGSGKTRLAIDVAMRLEQPEPRPAFARVAFVALVDCITATQLLGRLKLALRLAGTGDAATQLTDTLDGQPLLLVLDNAEQLDDEATALIGALAQRLPLVHWLVTSRRPLGLDGEREFLLAPLPLPAPRDTLVAVAANPAVVLFVDRARAHRPDFHVTAGNCASLAALVCWLDGLPLAIELAAARSRTLTPAQMLALLQAARSDPAVPAAALAWLSRRGVRAGSDPRHVSMLAVIEWSWKLLAPPLQALLDALCLLPAGATAGTAGKLAGPGASAADTQAMLDDLVAQSMLHPRTGQDGHWRYAASEPVREYARACRSADAARALRRRLLASLLDWARALPATPPLPGVREELPNLLAALGAARDDGHANDAVTLVLWLQSSWGEISHSGEALDALGHLLQAPGIDPSTAAGGHAVAAWSCFEGGRRDEALAHAQQALAQPITDEPLRAMVLSRVARVRWRIERDPAATRALLAEGLPLARRLGRHNTEAAMLSLEAHLATTADRDPARGAELGRQARALWQRSGNAHLVNAARFNQAVNHQQAGRHAQALEELNTLAEDGRALQDWDLAAGALDGAGTALLALRRWPEAARSLRQSLQIAWEAMDIQSMAFALWNIAPVLARQREARLAARTMGFAEALWQQRFGEFDASDRRDLRRMRRFTRCLLGAHDAQTAWQAGSSSTLADAVRAVLER